jgi:hypothetical protein
MASDFNCQTIVVVLRFSLLNKKNQLVASPWILIRDSNAASQADMRLCSKKKENDIVQQKKIFFNQFFLVLIKR